ncbi:unnamed protein product [Blepharisma stoltei]|uniref:Uncharacterized protein n=1 Tax=Blepharisma stoltei TaxID=1481888 RepID=A0AAU9KCJ7_9CILI|nr:unnamed protein product [Blepharisma stoltei]
MLTYKVIIGFFLICLSGYFYYDFTSIRTPFSNKRNPWTHQYSSNKDVNISDYDCPSCSWNLYTPNPSFTKFESIYEFNDEAIPPETPPILCIPDSFGYTHEEAGRIFPKIDFPDCVEKLPHKYPFLDLDVEKNILTMNCSKVSKYPGRYVLGMSQEDEELGVKEYTIPFEEYPGKPVKLKNKEEWAYATCYEDRDEYLEEAAYHHRPKPEILERPAQESPIVFISLTLDSVSRRNFYRKLPKTIEFLQSLEDDYKIFDFKIHNVMGEYSANNLAPQFFGDIEYKTHKDKVYKDIFWEKSIWKYAKMAGFVTLFIEDGCTNDLARYFGRSIKVDHIGTYFWCGAKRFNNYENNMESQRCIGRKNSHVYIYDYISEFSKNYRQQSQWVFTHINTAHENSGKIISTLDIDTRDFLKAYLTQQKGVKIVLFINGDHGMRYGEWFKKIDGSHEHRLPLCMFIASKSLLDMIPNSYDILTHNSNRLTTKLDLYTTQLHIFSLLSQNITKDSEEYKRYKQMTTERFQPISYFLEKAPNNRTCESIGVPAFWCSCLKFTEITNSTYPNFVRKLADEVIYQINEETNSPRQAPYDHICQKVTLKEIKKLWVLSISEDFYKFHIMTHESEKALYEAVVLVTTAPLRARSMLDAFTINPYFETGKKRIWIAYIRRVDSYAGICETITKARKISSELCICKNTDEIVKNEPNLSPLIK